MMKEIFKSNKLSLLNKFSKPNIIKAKSAFFTTSNPLSRTLDLEKNEKINDALKHKNFVSKKIKKIKKKF